MNRASSAVLWCFLFGNFVIGFGVLMVPGGLNDISHDLQVSVAQAGSLITAGAVLMCLSAPIFATVLAKHDRRKLLSWVMLWSGAAHALCVLVPGFNEILWIRVAAMVAPAIFTPQAAACIGNWHRLKSVARPSPLCFWVGRSPRWWACQSPLG